MVAQWRFVLAAAVFGYGAEAKMMDASDAERSIVRLHRGDAPAHHQKAQAARPDPKKTKVDQALIITLPKNKDRAVKVGAWLDKVNMSHNVLWATNGSAEAKAITDDKVTHTWDPEHNIGFQPLGADLMGKKINMTAGERGCAMSHVRAWQTIADTNKTMLILEDDAVVGKKLVKGKGATEEQFHHSFTSSMKEVMEQLPSHPDIMYLSYSLPPLGLAHAHKVSPRLMTVKYLWTTTGYVMTPEGARKALERLPVDQPVDNWLGKNIAEGHLNAFATLPELVSQDEGWGGASNSIGHSDYNAIMVHWRAFSIGKIFTWTAHAQSCIASVVLMFFIDVLVRSTFWWKLGVFSLLCFMYYANYALWRWTLSPGKPRQEPMPEPADTRATEQR